MLAECGKSCNFAPMITIQDILQNLLLQNDDNWEIESVSSDDVAEEIHVKLRYRFPEVKADGKFYPIYDYRHERNWRHLDLWQYKTFLEARIPRYRNDAGEVVSVEIPWALPSSRMSWLMEKKR